MQRAALYNALLGTHQNKMQPDHAMRRIHWSASDGLDKVHFTPTCLPATVMETSPPQFFCTTFIIISCLFTTPPKSATSAGQLPHGLANTQAQARGLLLATPAATPRRGVQACATTWPCQWPARVGAPPHRGLQRSHT
eukprot:COSAG01_NODE_7810_length_3046_cov_26.887343_1_plen_138_part_00